VKSGTDNFTGPAAVAFVHIDFDGLDYFFNFSHF
jgi:hypothetical protein